MKEQENEEEIQVRDSVENPLIVNYNRRLEMITQEIQLIMMDQVDRKDF